ncbi:archaellar assembly protein FlaJ [Methanoregula sp.]|uniref:archaellar assembly protein FlaJ n=1 Tax=Methanoregula sp. TaxID=2052170 RepID=UPI002C5A8DCA|nr:archaellar assembly protein FlaJ [Methanoregula sp.]HVP96162.1 archaellar assembly protein FlaJ [Methanoregula sp.]
MPNEPPPADPSKPESTRQLPFISMISNVKGKLAAVQEGKKMGADLLFMTTYMASLAIADATRPEIFSFSANRQEYISAKYIAKVDTFVKKWNYSYAESLSIVAERTQNEILRSMLNRYSNSIDSGVPDEDFLANELATVRSVYRNQLEQGMSMLQKWGDAYVAMLLSGTVIAVIVMISVVIYSPNDIQSSFNMSYAVILAISVFGIVLMYTSVPDDPKSHGLKERTSKEQSTIHAMERIIVPVTIAIVIILAALGIAASLIFILVGILMAPLGIIGFIDDHNITLRDNDFSVFIRSFGAIMGGQGTTAVYALGSIDRKSLPALEPLINSVYSKLNLGLDEKQIWDKFIGESGSNLIYKYLNIYRDTVALGGPPEPIGTVVGASMLEQTLLREKKDMLARGFIVLLVPMHLAMTGLFVALYQILLVLTSSVTTMMGQFQNISASSGGQNMGGVSPGAVFGGGMNLFSNFPAAAMQTYVIVTLTIITASNIVAARIVGGGDRYMYYFYTAIFCTLSGLVLLLAPSVVGLFFSASALTNMGGGVSGTAV